MPAALHCAAPASKPAPVNYTVQAAPLPCSCSSCRWPHVLDHWPDLGHAAALCALPAASCCLQFKQPPADDAPLRCSAWSEDGELMAVAHIDRPWFGVQFHPESLLTPNGRRLMERFLTYCSE